ncbi:ABC-F type ribosomal protection protein [Oscillospiraceae bacterium OttesenSCG-928-G22]|nr:ABC-F type ribosomal protection protein [Oscillospiraceae bacterium OttesenSCG-928-G22]
MSMIDVTNLTFSHEGSYEPVFENVSFRMDTDWRLGFTGRNGRGKTTFLNLLLGKYPYEGTIHASCAFDMFPFAVDDPSRAAADVLRGVSGETEEWRLFRELGLLAVEEDALYRPFSTLSPGERTKVMLAALFAKENNFLLIDEPTNHLDMEGRRILGAYLRKKSGFILVSHDRAFLDGCVDHILSINRRDIAVQKGNFSSFLHNKQMQDDFEQAEEEKKRHEIKKLGEAAKQTKSWSDKVEKTKKGTRNSGLRPDRGFIGHKAAKMMKRSKAIEERRERAVEEKSKLLGNVETAEALKIWPLPYKKTRLVEARGIALRYGEKEVFRDVSFTIDAGDRVSIRGRNGSGKSSLLRVLLRELPCAEGELSLPHDLVISYVSQDVSGLAGNLRDYADDRGIDESLFKAILRKFDFSRAQLARDISEFSDGQKKKVLLAESLSTRAHLYLWDEPLNYVDVFSRMQIEELLLDGGATMLFVEHDSAFEAKIKTQEILL